MLQDSKYTSEITLLDNRKNEGKKTSTVLFQFSVHNIIFTESKLC